MKNKKINRYWRLKLTSQTRFRKTRKKTEVIKLRVPNQAVCMNLIH